MFRVCQVLFKHYFAKTISNNQTRSSFHRSPWAYPNRAGALWPDQPGRGVRSVAGFLARLVAWLRFWTRSGRGYPVGDIGDPLVAAGHPLPYPRSTKSPAQAAPKNPQKNKKTVQRSRIISDAQSGLLMLQNICKRQQKNAMRYFDCKYPQISRLQKYFQSKQIKQLDNSEKL